MALSVSIVAPFTFLFLSSNESWSFGPNLVSAGESDQSTNGISQSEKIALNSEHTSQNDKGIPVSSSNINTTSEKPTKTTDFSKPSPTSSLGSSRETLSQPDNQDDYFVLESTSSSNPKPTLPGPKAHKSSSSLSQALTGVVVVTVSVFLLVCTVCILRKSKLKVSIQSGSKTVQLIYLRIAQANYEKANGPRDFVRL
jgi:hypothetical protein